MHMLTDGASVTSPKRTGWLASLFGSASKPMSSSASSQESEETLETDGAKKDEPAKNAEHITVPAKGKSRLIPLRVAVVSFQVQVVSLRAAVNLHLRTESVDKVWIFLGLELPIRLKRAIFDKWNGFFSRWNDRDLLSQLVFDKNPLHNSCFYSRLDRARWLSSSNFFQF